MLRSTGLVLFVLTLACDSPSAEPPTSDTCMPGGLEAAHSVETVRIPSGCRVTSGGTITAPSVIRSAEELTGALECDANTERPTIDFATHQLMLAEFSMSPAYGGSEVFDDGSKVTFVTRDRSPCPDDPMPMPMSSTLAYLLPQGAERSYQQLACTLPARCG
jgi:hypothetical protein